MKKKRKVHAHVIDAFQEQNARKATEHATVSLTPVVRCCLNVKSELADVRYQFFFLDSCCLNCLPPERRDRTIAGAGFPSDEKEKRSAVTFTNVFAM